MDTMKHQRDSQLRLLCLTSGPGRLWISLYHWSQPFHVGVGVSVESGALGWSQLFSLRSVSVESAVPGWSQRGIGLFLSESGWSQAFPAGVSAGPARGHQLLVARGVAPRSGKPLFLH